MTSDTAADALGASENWWSRFCTTPWRDLLRGRLTGSLDYRHAMAQFDLPRPILETIDAVVRQSRLWPREKSDVASELCAHFADGLAAGRTVEELQSTFGSTKASARLIRRAKIRCRPWSWHLWHRGWQTTLCLVGLFAAVWAVLAVRYISAKPTIMYDLIEQYDDQSRSIPEDERAWASYREGLVFINRQDLSPLRDDGEALDLLAALSEGPAHADWPAAREYLTQMQESVKFFAEGARRAELGFVNRDPGNEAWRQWDTRGRAGWETYNKPGTGGPMTLLAHAENLRIVRAFLLGALHTAIADGDGPRALELACGVLRLADHGRQTYDGFIADLVAFSILREALPRVTLLVVDHAELLTDADLQRLDACVRTALGGGLITFRTGGELRMWEDFLQRIYTDDGSGNGRITLAGLREIVASSQIPVPGFFPYVRRSENVHFVEDLTATFADSALAVLIADRESMRRKITEMVALHREMLTDLDTPPSESRYVLELQPMVEDDGLRYLPYTAVIGRGERHSQFWPARGLAAVNLRRDAALVAIALERHRREFRTWPVTLQELVPRLLSTVPVDPFSDGGMQPLTYRLVDGTPLLYSVGPNHADDGDWVLLPPSETGDM